MMYERVLKNPLIFEFRVSRSEEMLRITPSFSLPLRSLRSARLLAAQLYSNLDFVSKFTRMLGARKVRRLSQDRRRRLPGRHFRVAILSSSVCYTGGLVEACHDTSHSSV